MLTDEEDNLIDFLEDRYGCHTVILYGSRARGTHRPDSDYDILAICPHQGPTWYHDQVKNVGEVNAYIHADKEVAYNPENLSPLYRPIDQFFRLRQGRILIQQNNIGDEIIKRAKKLYAEHPVPFTGDRLARHRYTLLHFGLGRWRDPNLSSLEKRLMLGDVMNASLGVYFQQRQQWKPSHREALMYIRQTDPESYVKLEAALVPEPTVDALEAWFTAALESNKS